MTKVRKIVPELRDGYWWFEKYNANSPFGLARVLVDNGYDPASGYEIPDWDAEPVKPTIGEAAEQFTQQVEDAGKRMRGRAGGSMSGWARNVSRE